MGAHNFAFIPIFSQNVEFSAPNFVFWEKILTG